MSSAEPPAGDRAAGGSEPPAAGGAGPSGADTGLGPERTRLAWRRTALTASVCELLLIRQAADADGGRTALLATALGMLSWLGLVLLASVRIQAMNQARPIRLARLATGLVTCCAGLAAAAVMLIAVAAPTL
jgi:hypothetical protein